MAAPMVQIEGSGRLGPPLLFCDTFNHEENEEMHLDLVSFPRPVCISEVRVIPRGARPHVAVDKIGETHPPSFKLELFVRNLNKAQAVTFDKLGVLDYRESLNFNLNTKSECATDVVVLRGWYTRLTVCLYGFFTNIQEVSPAVAENSKTLLTQEISLDKLAGTPDSQETEVSLANDVKNEVKIEKEDKINKIPLDQSDTKEKTVTPSNEKEKEADEKSESGAQDNSPDSKDDLFEPLTPDKSPTDLFLSDEGEDLDQDGYEAILSDEEIMDDDHPYDETDVLDFQLFAEDTWMSVSVSFNPYQCDLSKLMSFPSGDSAKETNTDGAEKLKLILEQYRNEDRNERSVELLDNIVDFPFISLLCTSVGQKEKDLGRWLVDIALHALDLEEAREFPIAANIRRLKCGMKLTSLLSESSENTCALLVKGQVQEKICELLVTEHMSSSVKLVAFQALHSSLEFSRGMEHFIGWDVDVKDETTQEKSSTGYEKLIELMISEQAVRVVTAGTSLVHRVHIYEMLGNLRKVVENIVESTNNSLATRKEPLRGTSEDADTSMEMDDENNPIDLEALITAEQLEIVIGCLEEVHNVLLNAYELLVQPPVQAFPTTVKITALDNSPKNPFPMLYRMFSSMKLLESILVLFSCPVGFLPPIFTAIRDIFFYLLQSQEGLLLLLSNPECMNEIIRVLAQTETDFHYSEAPSLQDFLRDTSAADHCTPQHLGLLLIYHLQTLQAIDQLKCSHCSDLSGVDLDGADILSTLHSLYSMTFTGLGKAAVIAVLSMSSNLECLLPFVECAEKPSADSKAKKSVSSRYASVLILLTIQGSENVGILERFGERMWNIGQKDKESSLGQLNHWLNPVKDVNFEVISIPSIVEFVKSKADELNNQNIACGILTAVRVIRYLAVPKVSTIEGAQKDLNNNLACIQLFSSNAMDVFIKLTQKINEFLQRPWRQGQPFTNGHCFYVVSTVLPLLSLINQLLAELLSTSVYQFKDTRLLTELMTLYSIMCSVSGSLSSIAQKIQNEIVDVLMAFTRPVLQTTDTEEAINNSVWLLMLKELLQYTMSQPQFFLGGLSLLSELLPIPLPINTLEDLPDNEVEKLVKHRLLWSAHLNPLTSTIQSMLKDLSGSCCHSLQLVLRRVCCQLADVSASMALTVVRTLLEVVNNDIPEKAEEKQADEDRDKMSCSPHAMRVITLIAYLSSQPAVKSALLFFLKPGNPEEVPFPNLLNSLLHILQMASDEMAISRLKYCVVTIIQSLCDPQISLTLFDTSFSLNQLGDSMPDREMFGSICSALLENIGSSSQSYATILQVLRTIVMLTDHDYGMFHIKQALKKDKEVFYRLFQRLCTSFEPGIPGPDSLSTLSTVSELLQLLLPPHLTAVASKAGAGSMTENREQNLSPMEVESEKDVGNGQKDYGGEKKDEKKEKKDGNEEKKDYNEEEKKDNEEKNDCNEEKEMGNIEGKDGNEEEKMGNKEKKDGNEEEKMGDEEKKDCNEEEKKGDVEEMKGDGDELKDVKKDEKEVYERYETVSQLYSRKINVSVFELRELLETTGEQEHPLEKLETLLEKSCKEDETLEALLNGVTSLKKFQELEDDKSTVKDLKEDSEPILPAAQPLRTLFNKRAAFSAGEDVSGRVSPTLWYSTPPPDDVDVDSELVSCDLEEVKTKYFPEFNLKAELEKGLSSLPESPKRKRGLRGLGKRKFASMILEKGVQKKARQDGFDRSGRGGRGMFRGARGGQRYDNFRARKQNTSRPPSMHVDDFMAMEGGRGRGRGRGGQTQMTDRANQGPAIRKIQTLNRNAPDHHRMQGGFLTGDARWGLQNTPSRREVSLAMHPLRNQPAWEPRQQPLQAGFMERGFQRDNNWGTPATVNYRGFRDTGYRDHQVRGGYWAGPQQDGGRKDNRFLPPPPANFDNYRTGGNRGRHMRSFTR